MIFNKSKYICFTIDHNNYLQIRLDKFICYYSDHYNRSEIKKVFLNNNVFVNNKNVQPKYIVKLGDEICFLKKENKLTSIQPIKIKLDIIYEDDDIIAINKDNGLIVYPPKNNKEIISLVNGVIYYTKGNLSNTTGLQSYRPGIVHRLDKDTSGVIILAKNEESKLKLMKLFYEKKIYKEYIAIVHGKIKNNKGIISTPIMRNPKIKIKMTTCEEGKKSITKWYFLKYFQNYSIIKCIPITGRTHQIRVHLSSIGHPIVGDKVYNNNKNTNNFKRMFLHSYLISFIHPTSNQAITLKAPIPKEFDDYININ